MHRYFESHHEHAFSCTQGRKKCFVDITRIKANVSLTELGLTSQLELSLAIRILMPLPIMLLSRQDELVKKATQYQVMKCYFFRFHRNYNQILSALVLMIIFSAILIYDSLFQIKEVYFIADGTEKNNSDNASMSFRKTHILQAHELLPNTFLKPSNFFLLFPRRLKDNFCIL